MDFKIKLAKEEDLPAFFAIFTRSIKNQFPHYSLKTRDYFIDEGYNLSKIKKDIKIRRKHLFLAFINKKIIGFLLAQVQSGGVAFMEWLVVDSKHQKQGVASALLRAWEKEAIEDGAHKIQFVTDERNLNFYQKRGFVLFGKVSDDYFGADDYCFNKTLRKSDERNFLKDYLRKKKKQS